MLKLVLNIYKGGIDMKLIANGKINADACNKFGIYILEKKFT